MTLNLSKPGSEITANAETAIARVTQDNRSDGSIQLTIHLEERLVYSDGRVLPQGAWQAHSATYPDAATMMALAAATWAPDEAKREALAAECAKGPQEAAAAVLGAYAEILWAAQGAIASQASE